MLFTCTTCILNTAFFQILFGVSYSYSQWNQFHIHNNILHLNLAKVQWILHMLHLNLCRVFIVAILHYVSHFHVFSYTSVHMCHISFCWHVLHFNLRSQFHEFRRIAIFQYVCALCISMSCTWICSDNCRQTTIFQRVLCAFPCVTFQFVLTIVGWQLYLSCQVARCTCWARLNLGQSSCPSIHALPNTSLTPL